MPVEQIMSFWKRQPFAPFDIRMSDGRAYTIDHPDFLSWSRDRKAVIYQTEDYREVILAVSQITSVEVLNTRAA